MNLMQSNVEASADGQLYDPELLCRLYPHGLDVVSKGSAPACSHFYLVPYCTPAPSTTLLPQQRRHHLNQYLSTRADESVPDYPDDSCSKDD